MSDPDVERYLAGAALYGDDFDDAQIAAWLADEKQGYADLGAKDACQYSYEYHAWNWLHGYRHLPKQEFRHVLGFGSAYGEELLPILPRIGSVTIVEPSGVFVRSDIGGVAVRYVEPGVGGALQFPAETFDLVTCFGVLHHLPNVSFVVRELARSMRSGGYLLLREPIVSMGDWRQPRRGLTRHERGIPLAILEQIVRTCGLQTFQRALCGMAPAERLFRHIRRDVYNSRVLARIDAGLSAAFAWNVNYHPRSLLQRFRPTGVYLVLRKTDAGSPCCANG
ncbi:MAG: class I SAM-dependent methyltransferase [Gammaproteobacteria bacterium]|nr:class I SAM-dependent methyltransferase [Gammaproteobacteria bacterium]